MFPSPEAKPPQEPKDASSSGRWRGRTATASPFSLLSLSHESLGVRICQITLTILLCGYFLMQNDWQQQMWFIFACPVAFAFAPWSRIWPQITNDRFLRCSAHFLAWMTISSFLAHNISNHQVASEAAYWLYGTTLLIAFSFLCWHSASDLESLHHAGWWVGMAAALAALVSMFMFYHHLPDHVFGERLRNWFVYGGLNPVATGLTFGFASMWLTCARTAMQQRHERFIASIAMVILLLAVFFTRSRGAVLALTAGHLTLVWIYGLRANRTPLTIFLSIAMLFQISGPMVTMISSYQAASRIVVPPSSENPEFMNRESGELAPAAKLSADGLPPDAYRNPARELIGRGDNGRFALYQAAIGALQTPLNWTIGIGQWSTDHLWKPCISWNPEHMHSIFLATLIHGGLIGLFLLLIMYGIGACRAYHLAKSGHGTWLVLLVFGTTGLLFDGQTLTTFTSVPRMEVFLVSFPLVVAAAAYRHLNLSMNPRDTEP